MKEHHHYILTWDSEEGWFINEDLAEDAFQGVAVDVLPEPFANEEEANAFIERIQSAGIQESIISTGHRLQEQLEGAVTWLNDIPLFVPEEKG
jgi:hypothetical protein